MSKQNTNNPKGLTGLVNLGNTCFLNSCMQVLNHTTELTDFLQSSKMEKHIKPNLPDTAILKEWQELREIMWTNNGIVSPNKFVHNVHKLAIQKKRELFTGWAQNDMPEFLLFMVECMHNSISRPIAMRIVGKTENNLDELAIQCYSMLKTAYAKEYSEIMGMFYGIYVSEIKSLDGSTVHNYRPESFFMLDLPIGPIKTLYGCMDQYTQSEIMDGDNSWFNEKTGQKEGIQKRITFWNFPNVFVIALKRFSPDGSKKINDLVDFPLENLDLSKYVSGYNPSQYKYDLYGVCNHIGHVMGGHYTAFVKTSTNEWVHYNDSTAEIIKNPSSIVTPMAYCLFYCKKNN